MAMVKIVVIFPDDAPQDRISEVLATIAGKVTGWNVEIIFESGQLTDAPQTSPLTSPLDCGTLEGERMK